MNRICLILLLVNVVLWTDLVRGNEELQKAEKGIDSLPVSPTCKEIMKQGVREGHKYKATSVKSVCEDHKCKISSADTLKTTYPEMMKMLMKQFEVFDRENHRLPFDLKKTCDDIVEKCFRRNERYMKIADMCSCNKQDCIDKEESKQCIGDLLLLHSIGLLTWIDQGCVLAKKSNMVINIMNYMNKRAEEMPKEPICKH